MKKTPNLYKRYRFVPDIIQYFVWYILQRNLHRSLLCVMGLLYLVNHAALAGPVQVTVVNVEKKNIKEKLLLSTSIFSSLETTLSSEVSAKIQSTEVEAGDMVTKDQILALLRSKPTALKKKAAEAKRREDRAGVKLAKIEQRRLGRLLKRSATSQESYDTAVAKLTQAIAREDASKALVEQLNDDINKHSIVAPFDGLISERFASAGAWVKSADRLFTVVSIEDLHAKTAVPQAFFNEIKLGSEVSLALPGLRAKQGMSKKQMVKGWVSRLVPSADSVTRTFMVWVDFPANAGLMPGTSAKATFYINVNQGDQLVVPKDAIVKKSDGDNYLWVVKKDERKDASTTTKLKNTEISLHKDSADVSQYKVKQLSVSLGRVNDGQVEVFNEQLRDGDYVVVRGNENLRPDQPVVLK